MRKNRDLLKSPTIKFIGLLDIPAALEMKQSEVLKMR
jgi:hypothetical protein